MARKSTRAANKCDEHKPVCKPARITETSASLSTTAHQSEAGGITDTSANASTARHEVLLAEQPMPQTTPASTNAELTASEAVPQAEPSTCASTGKPTMEERQARLSALRSKMSASSRANRREILDEQSRARTLSQAGASTSSRKLAKAHRLLEERDMLECGIDIERQRNLNYSVQDSEAWDLKLEQKHRKKDAGLIDFVDAAERAYQRQVNALKPHTSRSTTQKDQHAVHASSPATGTLVRKQSTPIDELQYGSHVPTDDAVDRVITHLNHEKQLIRNRSRARNNDDSDINYINDSNRHFNKKLKRFYDKQTQEIRENLERGTAL